MNTHKAQSARDTKGTAPAAVGDRVTLVAMVGDPAPIPPGAVGTVVRVGYWTGGEWNLGVCWDNGRTLGLIYPMDKFTVEKAPV